MREGARHFSRHKHYFPPIAAAYGTTSTCKFSSLVNINFYITERTICLNFIEEKKFLVPSLPSKEPLHNFVVNSIFNHFFKIEIFVAGHPRSGHAVGHARLSRFRVQVLDAYWSNFGAKTARIIIQDGG